MFDKDPSIIAAPLADALPAAFCNGNTYPQAYDTLGRSLFLNITYDL